MRLGDLQSDLDAGKLLRRAAWPEGEFAFLVAGSTFAVNRAPLSAIFPIGRPITYRAHIDRHYADGTIGYWTPAQDDIQSDDWTIYAQPAPGPVAEPAQEPTGSVWLIQATPTTPVYTPRYWNADLHAFGDQLAATPYATMTQAQSVADTLNILAHVAHYARAG